ncbi:MAG: hypothetical protein IKX76_04660, partial [Eubacterium sp.]|nr:hypothetical protein [Eubacterium sp.]
GNHDYIFKGELLENILIIDGFMGTIYGNKKRRDTTQTSFSCGSPQFLDRGSIPLRSIYC